MKILSFGDVHYCAGVNDDIDFSFNQIIEVAQRVQPHIAVITGDIYDCSSDPDSRNRAIYQIGRLANICRVAIIQGNHDAPGDLAKFRTIAAKNEIHVFEKAGQMMFYDVALDMMPWFSKGAWIKANPKMSQEESNKSLSELALNYLRGVVEICPSVKHVLVFHGTIHGAKAENHQPLLGKGVELGVADLADAGFYAAIMGHIHKQQTFGPDRRFFYNGSICALNFGEDSATKFCSILDIDLGRLDWVPLKAIDRYSIDASYNTETHTLELPKDLDLDRISGARVRINYELPEGIEAVSVRNTIDNFFESLGALEIKPNPRVEPQEEARATAIAKATTLEEKLECYWKAMQFAAWPEGQWQSMITKLHSLSFGKRAIEFSGASQFEPTKISIRNVGPYDSMELDFTKLEGPIVAITGKNGEGKSFLLDSIFAALYRYFPSRDSGIPHYCRGRDSQILLEFLSGEQYRSIINIDAQRNMMEQYLYRNGNCVADRKVAPFKEYVAKHFGSEELILASAFATQSKAGNFLELEKVERKKLFVEMLGIKYLEQISIEAGAKSAEEHKKLVGIDAEIKALTPLARHSIADTESLKERIKSGASEVASLEDQLQDLNSDLAITSVQIQSLGKLRSDVGSLEEKIFSIQKKILDIDLRIENCRLLLERAQVIRGAVKELETHQTLLTELRKQDATLRMIISSESAKYRKYCDSVNAANREISDIQSDLNSVESDIRRNLDLISKIGSVPCKGEGEFASCHYLSMALKAKSQMPLLEEARSASINSLAILRARLEVLVATNNIDTLTAMENECAAVAHKISIEQSAVARLNPNLATLNNIENAEQRIEEFTISKGEYAAAITYENSQLSDLKNQLKSSEISYKVHQEIALKIKNLKAEISSRKKIVDDYTRTLMSVELENASITRAMESLTKKEAEKTAAAQDLREWETLEKAFGKNGIQSLEISAAGPGVSRIANDLLSSCFGTRFSVKFITQRLKADAKEGYTDDFDVVVIDTKYTDSNERRARDLSFGERAIIGEAICLAVALFNRAQTGQAWDWLFRDETSSSLDDENGPLYITMLRRAREIGDFKKVVFILHQKRLQELADSRIVVANGRAEVVT